MLFAVPTMYHRLAAELAAIAGTGGGRRPGTGCWYRDRPRYRPACTKRIAAATGQHVVERYGLTETLMNTAVRATGERRPGHRGARPWTAWTYGWWTRRARPLEGLGP